MTTVMKSRSLAVDNEARIRLRRNTLHRVQVRSESSQGRGRPVRSRALGCCILGTVQSVPASSQPSHTCVSIMVMTRCGKERSRHDDRSPPALGSFGLGGHPTYEVFYLPLWKSIFIATTCFLSCRLLCTYISIDMMAWKRTNIFLCTPAFVGSRNITHT
ncbi:hypothetical protein BDV95DRAFT_166479 [Massariosphaeria phaeospora]|uniref:Uncharacterized protein n=1 Tax=Massariosphaeria phaeospora TaxID=100035 RepID=A0A7C8I5T2_9PLEO|nr:hypothetical protein BDV95DRAFT_166479 [Massariosphaeria phaeospora]